MDRVYTREEVSNHNAESDLWLIYQNKVYDVSSFVRRHPGGWKVLVENAGREVTEQMSGEPHRHSQAALKMLSDYQIGLLQESDATSNGTNGLKSQTYRNGQVSSGGGDNLPEYSAIKKKYDDLVSANYPMFWEIGKLGKSYIDWIFTPEDKDLRFFESDFLESLTQCQWYIIPLVWFPLIALFLHLSHANFMDANGYETLLSGFAGGVNISVWLMPFLFLTGVLVWTLAEYMIHRWVFHLRPPHWSRVLITLHFLFHGQHHKNPMNKNRLVFPPVPAAPFAFFIWLLVSSLLPKATAQCILAGVAFGYVIYDLIHYYLHHGSPSTNYFKDLKNYHVRHHYVYHELGFGISSKLWDYPFGTVIPADNFKSK